MTGPSQEEEDFEDYFESYENLEVHRLMLQDNIRLKVYKEAIFKNKDVIANKVVLDVGAGTGILSVMCAQAGAKKVYAVEAAAKLVEICKIVVQENNMTEIVSVIQGRIEDIDLPSKVDVIISEWMGFYLFHESMLDSLLHARKHLVEGGRLFPESCVLYTAVCELPDHFSFWEDVHGVKMRSLGETYRKKVSNVPQICTISENCILTDSVEVIRLDLRTCTSFDQNSFVKDVFHVTKKQGSVQGVCLWFTVHFPSSSGEIILSTSPFDPPTHWKQTVIILPDEVHCETSDAVVYKLKFSKDVRKYDIELEVMDPESMFHPIPCSCNLTRCIVAKAFNESLHSK